MNKAEFPGIETCLIPLINDLHDLDEPLTIILDDLHSIEEKEIFHGIDFFIDNLPEKVRLVLSTREDPPLSLGRLRASRKLREIRQDDLRFSLEESRRFLNQNSSYDISPKESEALFKRTEGWVTGLQLVVTALEPQENKEEFIRNFSGNHYYIFDYLIEEVLSNLDKEMQSFLFEISIFKEFSTALCDQYLGLSSKDLIRYTARANLFLIPLDMENRWYRFHHLFSDFLRNRLLDSLTTEERKNKFLRAFHALSGADRFDDAFQMGIAGELWDECVSLLCQRIPSFRSNARLYELDGYLKQLPEEMVLNNAELFALSRWNLVGVKKDDRIFKGTMTPLLEGVNYYMAGFDLISNGENSRESRKAYQKAYELIPPEYADLRDYCRLSVGAITRIEGRLLEAEETFVFDMTPDRFERRYYSSVYQTVNRIELYREMGQISRAEEIMDETLRLIGELSNQHGLISAGFLWIQKAGLAYIRNELSEAYDYVRKGIRYCIDNDSGETLVHGYINKAQIEKTLDMDDKAFVSLQNAEDQLGDISSIIYGRIEARKAELKMKTGENIDSFVEKCRIELDKMKKLGPFPAFHFTKFIVYADYLILSGNFKEAVDILEYIGRDLRKRGQLNHYIMSQIRKACLLYKQDHRAEANRITEEILKLNGKERNLRVFLDAGEECPYLLSEADEKGLLPDFLKDFAQSDKKRKKVLLEINNYEESFNDRELDIIKYMGQGLSNQEIGDTIYLSINTVRWYARQIFSKLDVKRRGEAVAKAKTLGLV